MINDDLQSTSIYQNLLSVADEDVLLRQLEAVRTSLRPTNENTQPLTLTPSLPDDEDDMESDTVTTAMSQQRNMTQNYIDQTAPAEAKKYIWGTKVATQDALRAFYSFIMSYKRGIEDTPHYLRLLDQVSAPVHPNRLTQ